MYLWVHTCVCVCVTHGFICIFLIQIQHNKIFKFNIFIWPMYSILLHHKACFSRILSDDRISHIGHMTVARWSTQLQTKDADWLNKNNTCIYGVYKRSTSDLGTHTYWKWGDGKRCSMQMEMERSWSGTVLMYYHYLTCNWDYF